MKYSARIVRALTVAGASLVLTACAGLQDVDYKWCPPAEPAPGPAPAPAPVRQTLTLKADALFAFDKGGPDGLLAQGQQELSALARQVQANYTRIDRIQLIGHTDRLGPQAYNQRLSQERADTVMQYLREHGIRAPMTAIGKGESDPVTSGCEGNVATSELIACLQPDRRVEVDITGIKSN